jgi:glycosyltransferase involved in cell wall biosynthesis
MTGDRSLSIIIPAYCEAENILDTLENVTRALAPLQLSHEVLVIDDGSSDGTGALVTANLSRFPGVRLLINERNIGFGASYRRGVDAAALDHIVMVHGDNAWGHETLRELFSHVGEADIVIGYTRDMWRARTWQRTVISKTFTFMVNVITRRSLKYYNGLQIHRAPILKSLQIESRGYGFQAEVLVKALRCARTYREVAMDLNERTRGESQAFRLKNFVDVARTLALLCALPWTTPASGGVARAAGQ